MEIDLLALKLLKVFHDKEYRTYWEETEAIKKCLNSYDIREKTIVDEEVAWLHLLLDYAEGKKKWNTGGIWVCESHPRRPCGQDLSIDCKCGAPGMGPFVPQDLIKQAPIKPCFENKECPRCLSPLEDNGVCSDVGNNNCQYQA